MFKKLLLLFLLLFSLLLLFELRITFSAVEIKIGTILVCCYVKLLFFSLVVVVSIQAATCRLPYQVRPTVVF